MAKQMGFVPRMRSFPKVTTEQIRVLVKDIPMKPCGSSHFRPERRHSEMAGIAKRSKAGANVLGLFNDSVHGELRKVRPDAVVSVDHKR